MAGKLVTFLDGPLAGTPSLILKRAPMFLRGVRDISGKTDALDQLSDMLGAREQAFAYKWESAESVGMFICKRGGGGGQIDQQVRYRYVADQPAAEVLASNIEWAAWCRKQVEQAEGN